MSERSVVLIIALVVILAIVKTTVILKLRSGSCRRKPTGKPDCSDDGPVLDLHSTDDDM